MKIKNSSFCIMCFLFPIVFNGQIRLAELVQPSEKAKQSSNALFFVEFWATWCGPCINASKYLSVLQKQYPDNFYVISLSKENPEVVKKFLEKHKTDLAVAIDFEGESFEKYNITSLPHGVLLNANGDVLWKGHPAELKTYHLTNFLNQNTRRIQFKKMFKVERRLESVAEIVYHPKKDFEFLELSHDEVFEIQVIHNDSYVEVKGDLQDIFAYVFKVNKAQIVIDPELNKYYHMYFKKGRTVFENMSQTIFKSFDLILNTAVIKGDAIVMTLDNPRFWETNQINWGSDTSKYLIGDSQIQADNVTLNALKYKLSLLLKIPIVIDPVYKDIQEHDWQIHYKYFDLMQSDLRDNYGIGVDRKVCDYLQYTITRKEL